MFVYAASNGIIVHTLPLLYPSLIEEFGWSTAQITLPATAFFIFGAVTSPPAGALFDRFPVRRIMSIGVSSMILSLLCFSFISELWQLVTVYLIFGLSLSLCGLTASMVILTKWFDGKRGRATGLLLMSSSFGGAVFPLILGAGIESMGWRDAIVIVCIVATLMTLPSLWFLILNAPESKRFNDLSSLEPKILPAQGPTLREAIRAPTFYLVAIATGSMWFAIVALIQHQSIHLVKDVGIDSLLLPKVFSTFFACSVLGKFTFGWLSDHLNKELSMIGSISLFASGLIIINTLNSDDLGLLFVYAVVAGIGFSGAFTTIQLLIAEHFSGSSYGKILASIVMIDSLAGRVGTRVIATMRDSSDNYTSGWYLLLVLCVLSILCTFMIKHINSPKLRDENTDDNTNTTKNLVE